MLLLGLTTILLRLLPFLLLLEHFLLSIKKAYVEILIVRLLFLDCRTHSDKFMEIRHPHPLCLRRRIWLIGAGGACKLQCGPIEVLGQHAVLVGRRIRLPLGSMALCLVEQRIRVGLIIDYKGRLRIVGVLVATRDDCRTRISLR